MKDIMQKLAELEATAPKITKKKLLNEDSATPPINVSNKPASLKDMFEAIGTQKPIPVVGKQGDQQQTGAGFLNINDNSPAGQAIEKALTDLAGQGKAQIVVPTTPQDAPAQAGAAGVRAVQQVGQGQPLQQKVQETSHGEKTINTSFGNETGDYDVEVSYDFDDYGDIEITGVVNIDDGEDMYDVLSGADLDKLKADVEMQLQADRDDEGDYRYELSRDKLDELSKKTLGNYINKANNDSVSRGIEYGFSRDKKDSLSALEKLPNRTKGIDRAVDKLTGKAKVPAKEGKKVDRMVKHIEKSEKKSGKSKEEAQDIAWATANKRGMLDNKNKKKVKEGVDAEIADIRKTLNSRKGKVYTPDHPEKKETEQLKRKLAKLVKSKEVKEGDIAPTNGIDTKGAGLGAGRSQTTLEGKKPDFLDLDKDGNKKESMKKAAADKKKQKVKESMNHKLSAARLEGKSHGLRGHAHHGKAYEDLEEMRAYHEGYKEGLDECYGQGVYETAMPATVGGMASSAMPAMPSMPTMEDEMEEGNAFTAALAKTPKGGKFSVGGKTYTDRTNYDTKVDEYAFESLDSQLNALLNESEDLNEGLSVSVSKGQQNSPDSVTITAQDAEADQLLQLVKHAGLGLFGDDHAEPSSAMSVQPSMGEPDEVGAGGVDVEVVDGNDGIMGLMQKLSGIQAAGSDDYEDEEGDEEQLHGNQSHTHEETCNECGGMMEAGHSCGSKMDEEESEDQMEFEVSEDNAPDSDEAETSADEDAEAKEDAALAGEKEEEMNESFASILERLTKLAEGSGDKPKHPEHDEKDDKDFDDAEEEEVNESKESTEEKDEKAEKAGKKVAKDIEYDEDHKGKDDNKAEKAGKKVTKDIEYDDKKEKIDEWANDAGKKGTDASFEQDIDFMTKVISGGLNKPKSTGQTTVPVIPGQTARMHDHQGTVSDSVDDWVKLAGIK